MTEPVRETTPTQAADRLLVLERVQRAADELNAAMAAAAMLGVQTDVFVYPAGTEDGAEHSVVAVNIWAPTLPGSVTPPP